jgi:hypothetical protein
MKDQTEKVNQSVTGRRCIGIEAGRYKFLVTDNVI